MKDFITAKEATELTSKAIEERYQDNLSNLIMEIKDACSVCHNTAYVHFKLRDEDILSLKKLGYTINIEDKPSRNGSYVSW